MRRFIFYPFMFVVYQILTLLGQNPSEIGLNQLWRPLFLLLEIVLITMLVVQYFLKDWHHTGFVVFVFLTFFYGYGYIKHFFLAKVPEKYAFVLTLVLLTLLWIILVIIASKKVWHRFGNPKIITHILNVIILIALVISLFQIAPTALAGFSHSLNSENPLEVLFPNEIELSMDVTDKVQPDIYIIIVDGYARQDVLADIYKFDNSKFLDYLEAHGFYIADQSYSNYVQTTKAVASLLNLDYFSNYPPEDILDNFFNYLKIPLQENKAMTILKNQDYQVITFETGLSFTEIQGKDLYLTPHIIINDIEELMLSYTPIAVELTPILSAINLPTQSYNNHRNRILYTFEQLQGIPSMPGSKFVFAHIVSPHPPFVFDRDGNPINPDRPYSISDGDNFKGDQDEYRRGYVGQVGFINYKLEETIDAILQGSDSPPVIILMADHGPGSMFSWDSEEQRCLWERTSILNAFFLPEEAKASLYNSISPVNSLRLVFNIYFGTNLDILEDKTFYSNKNPYVMVDITAKRDKTIQCTNP